MTREGPYTSPVVAHDESVFERQYAIQETFARLNQIQAGASETKPMANHKYSLLEAHSNQRNLP